MNTPNTTPSIHFNSDRERKSYEAGLIQVRAKIAAGKVLKTELANRQAAADRTAIVKRLGSKLAATCYGIKPIEDPRLRRTAEAIAQRIVASALKPAATVKRYAAPALAKRSAFQAFQSRTVKRFYCASFAR